MPGLPYGADFYNFWHVVLYGWLNHPCQILSRLVKGLGGYGSPKLGVSHWLWMSLLQQCYALTCYTVMCIVHQYHEANEQETVLFVHAAKAIYSASEDDREQLVFPWYQRTIFTVRCTLVQSAVLGSHVVCLSVSLSVCDVGGLWLHRLQFFENNFKVS